TGSSRSSARVVPGPTSSARAEAPELLRVVLRPPPVAAMALMFEHMFESVKHPGAHDQRTPPPTAVSSDRIEPATSALRHAGGGSSWARPNQAEARKPKIAAVAAASRRN